MTELIASVANAPRPWRRILDPLGLVVLAVPIAVVLAEVLTAPFFLAMEYGDEPLAASLSLLAFGVTWWACSRGATSTSRPAIRVGSRFVMLLLSVAAGLMTVELLYGSAIMAGVSSQSHDPEWGEPAAYAGLALAHAALAAAGFRIALCPAARYWVVFLATVGLAIVGVLAAGANYLALLL